MFRSNRIVVSALATTILLACPSPQGGEGQACYANGTCNAGLTCLSKLCVNAGGNDAGGGSQDAGGTADAGNASADSGNPVADSGTPDSGNAPDAGPPSPPTLGPAIDRAGRPGINNLLNDTFDPSASSRGTALDAYNAADSGAWPTFEARIAASLGPFDGLDGVCENQFLAASPASASSYQRLGNVLVDDQLYVNTASTTCSIYLGVELNSLGQPNTDCGGLTPLENAIDATYSLLVNGQASSLTNGITSDSDHTASTTVFPYLATPN